MPRIDLEVVFNQFEALLWLSISLGVVLHAIVQRLKRFPIPLYEIILIPAFALFGLSDFIEAQTGAWWTPWWLFAIKVLCVATFFFSFMAYRKHRQKIRSTSG